MRLLSSILPNALTGKLSSYFKANPEEELLYSDACTKLDCTPKQLSQAVSRLKSLGIIEVVHVIRVAPGGGK